jgi:chemotaxis protein CheY-P-specific phosphatase CheC
LINYRARSRLETAAASCAERLSAIAGLGWSVGAIDVDCARQEILEPLLDSGQESHGSWFSFPGGSLLVVIPYNAGLRVVDYFTRKHEIVDTLEHREAQVLSEVSCILANVVTEALSKDLDKVLIVSAPSSMLDTQREVALTALQHVRRAGPSAIVGLVRLNGPAPLVLSLLVILDAKTASHFG